MDRDDTREPSAQNPDRRVQATVDHGHAVPRFRLDERAEADAWLSVQYTAVVSLEHWS